MNINNYPVLYESCRLVKGYNKSLIVDIHRNSYFVISNDLYLFLNECRNHKICKWIKKNGKNILKNLDILIENDIIFLKDRKNLFPRMQDDWHLPNKISNSILYISDFTENLISSILKSLESLQCYNIELRIKGTTNIAKFQSILFQLESKWIYSVSIFIEYSTIEENEFKKLIIDNNRIYYICVFNCIQDNQIIIENNEVELYFTTSIFEDISCGFTSQNEFTVNRLFFFESSKHNSCLNRKISIDAEGNIKNCPSMKESYGNIKDTTLAEALEKPGFKKYWNINKDQIAACKDCEFRYICTDYE